MFTSFNEDNFYQELQNKDYLRLKIDVVSTILCDPTFENDELSRVLKILKDNVPEIFENYKKLEFENLVEPDKWDKKYFGKLTYWFQENFCLERLDYIKEVGRAVYKTRLESERMKKKNDEISQVNTNKIEKEFSNKKDKKINDNYQNMIKHGGVKKDGTFFNIVLTGIIVAIVMLIIKILSK